MKQTGSRRYPFLRLTKDGAVHKARYLGHDICVVFNQPRPGEVWRVYADGSQFFLYSKNKS